MINHTQISDLVGFLFPSQAPARGAQYWPELENCYAVLGRKSYNWSCIRDRNLLFGSKCESKLSAYLESKQR